jgi:Xaa-Pro aminopeptidase
MRYAHSLLSMIAAACVMFLFWPPPASGAEIARPVRAELVRVIDGDTFIVDALVWPGHRVRVSIRLRGIDAPEMRSRCAAEKEAAIRARDISAFVTVQDGLHALCIARVNTPHGVRLLIDVGSTTADIVPIADGRIAATATNDLERLLAGELVRRWLRDRDRTGRLALQDRLWTSFTLALQAALPDASWLPGSQVMRALRIIKDDAEVAALRDVGAAIDTVHAAVPELLRPGRTEAEVGRDIGELILEDHDEVNFIIVASGPNGASPHHETGDRVLQVSDAVVVDIGGTRGGYCSDVTRDYVIGEAPDGYGQLHDVLERAREREDVEIDSIQLGTPASAGPVSLPYVERPPAPPQRVPHPLPDAEIN